MMQDFIRGDRGKWGAFCPTLQGFASLLGICKLMCTHTNLDCRPPKIFNAQFLLPPSFNKILNEALQWYKIPSHPTPASAEWRQLCDRIGLLEHSSSWLELEVHWTSSRNIGPLPAPKWALLYALPPKCTGTR